MNNWELRSAKRWGKGNTCRHWNVLPISIPQLSLEEEKNETFLCNRCRLPISDLKYICNQCQFYLHKYLTRFSTHFIRSTNSPSRQSRIMNSNASSTIMIVLAFSFQCKRCTIYARQPGPVAITCYHRFWVKKRKTGDKIKLHCFSSSPFQIPNQSNFLFSSLLL